MEKVRNMSLKNKVITIVSVIIAIITVAAIISSYTIFFNSTLQTTKETQYRVALYLSDVVYEKLHEIELSLVAWSKFVSHDKEHDVVSKQLDEFKNLYIYENAAIGYEDGEFIINYSSRNSIPANFNFKDAEWYKNTINSDTVHFSAPYLDVVSDKIVVYVSAPIVREDGVKGVMMADFYLNLDFYLKEYANENVGGGIILNS